MAKNIDFMGAIFPDVPSVKLPQQGGGLVAFDDTTDATATADKILQGYTAYANGQKLVGTASGGGGGIGTLLHTENLGLIQYSSTAAGSLDKSITVSGVTDYDLLIVVISADNKIANQHQATASFILMITNGSFYSDLDGKRNSRYPLSDRIQYIKNSSGNIASRAAQNGVYPYAPTVASDGTITMPIYARYNGNTTGTINDTYTARVYGVNVYELL